MTRKSQSRLRRDEFKKDNKAWDDLRQLYMQCQSNLNVVVRTTQAFFAIPDIHKFVPKVEGMHTYAAATITSLASDVRNFQTRLNDIYKRHSSRSGMFKFDGDNENAAADYVLLISLGDEYVKFQNDYTTILLPVYNQALGLMHSIEENIARIASQETPAPEQVATA